MLAAAKTTESSIQQSRRHLSRNYMKSATVRTHEKREAVGDGEACPVCDKVSGGPG